MKRQLLYEELEQKDRNLNQIADKAIADTITIDYLIDGLSAEKSRIKYGCSNTLVAISKKQPDVLYAYFDFFERQLQHKNKFIKWGAIIIIANLTKVDNKKKFDKIFNKYYFEISGPIMITASNIIKGSATIAKAKPYLTNKITRELLKVKNAKYQTPECNNVVLAQMIAAFNKFFKQVENKDEVIALISEQTGNPRQLTKNKAEKFINKWIKK